MNKKHIRRHKVDKKSFSRPFTLEACYWAGFLAADGCLRKSGPWEITLTVNYKDHKHLIKFKEFLKFSGKVKIYHYDYNGKTSRFSVANEELYKDLVFNFNLKPKKSLTLKPPQDLSPKQSLAFIKGYIDGDGSICLKNPKNKLTKALSVNIVGTHEMLSWIKEKILYKNKINQYSNEKVYRIDFGGNRMVPKLLLPLKKLRTPYLARKWDKIK